MSDVLDVIAIVGSLRRESYTRRLVEALSAVSPASMHFDIVSINALTMYNQDEDVNPPSAWTSFRERIKRCDAVLFATPEYNRSIPGVLKNAIDIGSRPYGSSAWARKPAAIISCSPGSMGAFGANHHLRQCLVFLDMPTLQQPEAYIAGIDKLVNAGGEWLNPASREFGVHFVQAFERWIHTQKSSSHNSKSP